MGQHRLRRMALEIHQREQLRPVPLGAEDQLVLTAMNSQLEGRRAKGQFQGSAAFFDQLPAPLPQSVRIII